MSKALVLLSGGMDSTTCLAEALNSGLEAETISINYGQRHGRELLAAATIAQFYHVPHSIVDLSDTGIFDGSLSSQVNRDVAVPLGHYADESMKTTVVPNRNMMLLSIAGAAALSRGCDRLIYGAHAGDHAIYPDCRPQFVDAMAHAFRLADWKVLKLVAPYLTKSKADIVTAGNEFGVPFALTYSCYTGEPEHCGRCGTCVERREAFTLAGVADPTQYSL
jgi:7-cyano-7-deazaguanine synthase